MTTKENINVPEATAILTPCCVETDKPFAEGTPYFTTMKMIEDLGYLYPTEKSKEKKHFAIYECPFCGINFRTQTVHVNRGAVKSCGCYRHIFQKERPTNHGMKHTLLYGRWGGMITRVTNPNIEAWMNYGGRGITVCDEWRDFRYFMKWALSNGYEEGFDLEIDRIDNNGNYEPENCRFTTASINGRNKRHSPDYGIYTTGERFYILFRREGKIIKVASKLSKEEAIIVRDKFLANEK